MSVYQMSVCQHFIKSFLRKEYGISPRRCHFSDFYMQKLKRKKEEKKPWISSCQLCAERRNTETHPGGPRPSHEDLLMKHSLCSRRPARKQHRTEALPALLAVTAPAGPWIWGCVTNKKKGEHGPRPRDRALAIWLPDL